MRKKISLVLCLWLLLAIVPAAIGKEIPHGIRSLTMLPAMILIISYGLLTYYKKYKAKKLLHLILIFIFLIQYVIFLKDYFIKFPVYGASDWQYGMQEAVQIAKLYEDKVDKILITSFYGQPHVSTYVYQQKNPVDVIYGEMGKKYQFRNVKWEGDQFCQKCLIIGSPEEIPEGFPDEIGTLIDEIKYPDGKVAFKIVMTK